MGEHSGDKGPLTVGELRRVLDDPHLPDDRPVCVDFDQHGDLLFLLAAHGVASDCVPEPWGTDPIEEATVGVLELRVGDLSGRSEQP